MLSVAPDPGFEDYVKQFHAMKSCPEVYFTVVIVSKTTDQIVAVGSIFLERKFLHGLAMAGHIEDIAVEKAQQGKKLGLRIIQALLWISETKGCYKTILNCNKDNIPFYEKCGFQLKENEMAKYHDPALAPH